MVNYIQDKIYLSKKIKNYKLKMNKNLLKYV